jgi:hypothetical protein
VEVRVSMKGALRTSIYSDGPGAGPSKVETEEALWLSMGKARREFVFKAVLTSLHDYPVGDCKGARDGVVAGSSVGDKRVSSQIFRTKHVNRGETMWVMGRRLRRCHLLSSIKIMSRSFTIGLSQDALQSNLDNLSTTAPNGSCSTTTSPNCVPYTTHKPKLFSKMNIYIFISMGVILIVLIIALSINSQAEKKIKNSISIGNPRNYKMGISW